MVREIVFRSWCDACPTLGRSERSPVEDPHSWAVDKSGSIELDLCDECMTELTVVQFLALLSTRGRRDGKPARLNLTGELRTPGRPGRTIAVDMPNPGAAPGPRDEYGKRIYLHPCLVCEHEPYRTMKALREHYKYDHSIDLDALIAAVTACPICNTPVKGDRSMRNHVGYMHPGKTIAELFREARTMGDPHGLIVQALDAATIAA